MVETVTGQSIGASLARSEEQLQAPVPTHFSAIKDRAVALLGQGVRPSIVAEACGVSPAYVSQILQEPAVAEEVARLRAVVLEKAVEHDTNLGRVEELALRKVESSLMFVKSPLEAARIFQIVNGAKRKAQIQDTSDAGIGGGDVLTILLPKAATEIFIKTNSQNQVIDVDGRSLAPMPSRMLTQFKKSEVATVADVAEKLPAPVPGTKAAEQVAISESLKAANVEKAKSVMDDMVTVINGVRCVL